MRMKWTTRFLNELKEIEVPGNIPMAHGMTFMVAGWRGQGGPAPYFEGGIVTGNWWLRRQWHLGPPNIEYIFHLLDNPDDAFPYRSLDQVVSTFIIPIYT